MRELSKPFTAQCNRMLYTLFLLSESKYVSCVRLSEILAEISHNSVNRFLLRERYTPKDLFDEVKGDLSLDGGTLSVDDSVEAKPYRDRRKSAFVAYFYSGKHKRPVKGMNLITLYYSDPSGHQPCDLSIAQAVIAIAKLGGFLARKCDGDSGPTVIWKGWTVLQNATRLGERLFPQIYG